MKSLKKVKKETIVTKYHTYLTSNKSEVQNLSNCLIAFAIEFLK